MGRLFAGTPWDRPPTCDRCGRPESECTCPPAVPEAPASPPPECQTAHLRLQKRPKGKVVTRVEALDLSADEFAALAARLKAACGTGGTVKQDDADRDGRSHIELQGDHRDRAEAVLREIGYRIRRA